MVAATNAARSQPDICFSRLNADQAALIKMTPANTSNERRPSSSVRIERDFLGEREIPSDAYWGIHTARAVENFPITGHRVGQMGNLVRSLAYVKKSAAIVNAQLGVIPVEVAHAIENACDDLIEGRFHEQFVVDVLQGGAGMEAPAS